MPWNYMKIEPKAPAPCPWCHSSKAVKRDIAANRRYDCAECGTRFEAYFEAAAAQPSAKATEESRPGE